MSTEQTYPLFYRLEGRCLKRESDMTGMEVQIPPAGKSLPLVHSPFIYPSKERLDEACAAMQLVDQEIYEQFLTTFYSVSDNNRQVWIRYRETKRAKAFELNSQPNQIS